MASTFDLPTNEDFTEYLAQPQAGMAQVRVRIAGAGYGVARCDAVRIGAIGSKDKRRVLRQAPQAGTPRDL